jgi:hypothetical protein
MYYIKCLKIPYIIIYNQPIRKINQSINKMSAPQQVLIMPIAFSVGNSDTLYYRADELKTFSPEYFKGTSKSIRVIIIRKNIPPESIIYGLFSKKDNKWSESSEINSKAKVLISKEWIDVNMFKKSTDGNNTSELDVDCVPAPEIIQLNDDEKFKDYNGNIVEIETRGEKSRFGIFFNASDISEKFDMPSLVKNITSESSEYKLDTHYKKFSGRCHSHPMGMTPTRNTLPLPNIPNENTRTVLRTEYFLTYKGLVRYFIRSNNPNAEFFQDWAESKLFAHQMGSVEDKIESIADSLKISTDKATKMYKRMCGENISCIYLMEIGTAAQLRISFGIPASVPDTDIIYKYGHTDNLIRRMGEHNSDYGRTLNKEIYVEVFAHIDDSKTSEAENDIRKMFAMANMAVDVEGRKELVMISSKNLKYVRDQFIKIGNEFSGKSETLRKDIMNLNKVITDMFNENNAKSKEIEHLMEKNETLKEKLETLDKTTSNVLKYETDYLKLKLASASSHSELSERILNMEIQSLKLALSTISN